MSDDTTVDAPAEPSGSPKLNGGCMTSLVALGIAIVLFMILGAIHGPEIVVAGFTLLPLMIVCGLIAGIAAIVGFARMYRDR